MKKTILGLMTMTLVSSAALADTLLCKEQGSENPTSKIEMDAVPDTALTARLFYFSRIDSNEGRTLEMDVQKGDIYNDDMMVQQGQQFLVGKAIRRTDKKYDITLVILGTKHSCTPQE